MKTDFFYGCVTIKEVEQRNQDLSVVFRNQEEMLKDLREEFSALMKVLRVVRSNEVVKEKATVSEKTVEAVKEKATVSEKITELQEKIDPAGLSLEICGTWLWVTGKTFQVKDILKELGFRYSANKLAWYYRQAENLSGNQEPLPIEKIRELYGASLVAL
jgi:hypothetical protein